MLVSDSEAAARISSPLNLLNKLSSIKKDNLSVFGISRSDVQVQSPLIPPSVDELVDDAHSKLRMAEARSLASDIMIESMRELNGRLSEVTKPERLATIAADMNKIVTSNDSKSGDNLNVKVTIYAPQILNEAHFDVVEANE